MSRNRQRYLKRAYSKDVVATYTYNTGDAATVFPDFSLQRCVEMVNSDPVARAALTHFVDKCMEGDYAILKRDTKTYDKEFEDKLDREYNFRTEFLRKTFRVGKLFQNVFWEIIRKTDGSVKALNVLSTENIEPITDTNGDPIKYVSKYPNPLTGEKPAWEKDEVVWVKFSDQSLGYGPVDLRALYDNLCWKQFVTQYVAWLWQTGQYRPFFNPENADEKSIVDFLAYAKRNNSNFRAPFILKGKMNHFMVRDMKETSSVTEMLKYLDSQTLVLLRVSPIDVGIPDASGRSNADAQSNSLSTSVTGYKRIVEDYTNNVLFPRISKGNSLLRFAPNDRFEEKQLIENVVALKNVGMTEEAIKEYLQDRGMFFGAGSLFEKQPEPGMDGTSPSGNDPNAPSRQPKGKQGTGEAASTRQEQVSAR